MALHSFIKTNTIITKQISFKGILEDNNSVTLLFIAEKHQKTIFNFSQPMEHQKILNLLNEASNILYDQSNANYDVGNEIIYNTEVLRSNLCNCNDAYIVIRANITILAAPVTEVAFKDGAPFTKCITKIDGTAIDDAEELELVMSMYNLIEYSWNYSVTTVSLWFYPKDEATNFNVNITDTDAFKSFKYKAKLIGDTIQQLLSH